MFLEVEGNMNENETEKTNNEWAKVMNNILTIDKPKSKKFTILSRAAKVETKQEESEDENDKNSSRTIQGNQRKEWISRGRYKPNVSEAERERKLRRIAIAGVVQLFNAVGKHQRLTLNDASHKGSTRTVKSPKPLDKKSFFGLLLGKEDSKNEIKNEEFAEEVKEEEVNIKIDEEKKEESTPKWDVLRNDFMMSTKLKDWDKQMDT